MAVRAEFSGIRARHAFHQMSEWWFEGCQLLATLLYKTLLRKSTTNNTNTTDCAFQHPALQTGLNSTIDRSRIAALIQSLESACRLSVSTSPRYPDNLNSISQQDAPYGIHELLLGNTKHELYVHSLPRILETSDSELLLKTEHVSNYMETTADGRPSEGKVW